MRTLDKIIVHCSDSDIPDHDNIKTIDDWHRKRGFDSVGYHYFIRKDGTIEIGRPLDQVGAHCKGYNQESIGICLSGRTMFTSMQMLSLRKLIQALRITLGSLDVYPHRAFNNNKTCPNFDIYNNTTLGLSDI